MWTFKGQIRGGYLAALSLILIGCAGGQEHLSPGLDPVPRAVTISSADVPIVIAAPQGFCVDRATIDEAPQGVFMFLSDCHIRDNGRGARTPITAILTAGISPTGLPGVEQGLKPALTALAEFLNTPVGAFSMSKSNVEGAATILQSKQSERALYLLIHDAAYNDQAGASNRFWRAFTEINGRLVSLSVTGYNGNDPDEERALRIIRTFMQTTLDANMVTP